MTRNINEQLSALLDGELPEEQEELLLRRLERGEDHCATLVRYSLIGEMVRGTAPDGSAMDIVTRVRSAIDSARETKSAAGPASRRTWAVPIAGAGLAAAAALVAVVTLNQPATPIAQPASTPLAAVAEAPPVGELPDSLPAAAPAPAIAPQRMTTYLVSHGDYAGSLSRHTVNSHVVNSSAGFMNASYRGGRSR